MKKKRAPHSTFFNRPVSITLLILATSVFLALFVTANPSKGDGRELRTHSSESTATRALLIRTINQGDSRASHTSRSIHREPQRFETQSAARAIAGAARPGTAWKYALASR